MRQRVRFGIALTLLLMLTALVIWQSSFTVGEYGPSTPEQTYVFWALSTLIFLLTVLLAFMASNRGRPPVRSTNGPAGAH